MKILEPGRPEKVCFIALQCKLVFCSTTLYGPVVGWCGEPWVLGAVRRWMSGGTRSQCRSTCRWKAIAGQRDEMVMGVW